MTEGIDISCAQFTVEVKTGPSAFRLSWPTDPYFGLVKNPVLLAYKDVAELMEVALSHQPDFLDTSRLNFLLDQFERCAKGQGQDWPSMPVLQLRGGELKFVDGRHRCQALSVLGASRLPVLVTQ
jgi:hypothetical protein